MDVNNKLIAFCGDSTTEAGNSSGGLYDRFMYYMGQGRSLSGAIGVINYGKSGYTLQSFATDPATPGFVGAQPDSLVWDYRGNKPADTPTLLDVISTNQFKIPDIYVICYGINDCILSALGEDTENNIVSTLKPYLQTVIDTIQTNVPDAHIVLRSPNSMVARELDPLFPTMPNWGVNEANDQATMDTINTALKRIYSEAHSENPTTYLMDYETLVAGAPDTTQLASVNPILEDLVHPNSDGYSAIADGLAQVISLSGQYVEPYVGRVATANLYASSFGGNPWDYYGVEAYYAPDKEVYVIGDESLYKSDTGVEYDGTSQRSQIPSDYSNPYTRVVAILDCELGFDTGLGYLYGRIFGDGGIAITYNYDTDTLDCFCSTSSIIFGQCSINISPEDVGNIRYEFSVGYCELFLDGVSVRKTGHSEVNLSLRSDHSLMSRGADLYSAGRVYGFCLKLQDLEYCRYMSNDNYGGLSILDLSGNGRDATLVNNPEWIKRGVNGKYDTPALAEADLRASGLSADTILVYTDATPFYPTGDPFWSSIPLNGFTLTVIRQASLAGANSKIARRRRRA